MIQSFFSKSYIQCCTEIKMNCLDSKRSTEASTSEGLDQFKANDDESTANAKGDFDANVSTLQDSHTLSNSRLMAFKLEWNGWASRTTFHGIVNIVDNGLLLIRRIVWFVLIVAGVYGLVSNTVSQTQRFLEYRTLTQDTIFYDPDLKLPAVTVCSMNTLDSTSFTDKRDLVILRNLYVGMSNRSALLEYPGEEYVKNVSLKELFRSGFMSSNKTFRSCFRPRGGTLVDCVSYGMAAGFKIAVHDANETPDMKNALAIGPGLAHFITINKHEHKYMPPPVRAFGDRVCVTFEDLPHNYSISQCLRECNRTECDPLDLIDCYKNAVVSYVSQSKEAHCDCPFSCNENIYVTKLTSTYFPSDNYLKMMYPNLSHLEELARSYRANLMQVQISFECLPP